MHNYLDRRRAVCAPRLPKKKERVPQQPAHFKERMEYFLLFFFLGSNCCHKFKCGGSFGKDGVV